MDANRAVMTEQQDAHDWPLWERACEVAWFVEAFNKQFFDKLGGCPAPVFSYKNTHAGSLGSYRLSRNEFGLDKEINLNRQYLNRPLWSVLATVFHEMVHAWEHCKVKPEARTRSWFHKQAFKDVMEAHGIHCQDNGAHEFMDVHGEFVWFLKKHGVKIDPSLEEGLLFNGNGALRVVDKRRATVKRTQKWTCACPITLTTRVNVDVDATCNDCRTRFMPVLD